MGGALANQAILTGEPIDAGLLHARGLIALVAGQGFLKEAAEGWFSTHFAPKSAAGLRHAAAAARLGLLAHVRQVLPRLERLYLDDLMRTEDAVEGIAAFMAKRAPSWTDR